MKLNIKSTQDTVYVNVWQFLLSFIGLQTEFIYHSRNYDMNFDSFSDYWMQLGARNELVKFIATSRNNPARGYSMNEMLQKIGANEYGMTVGIILHNIDLSEIGKLKDRLPKIEPKILEEDFVFIPVKNRYIAEQFVKSIPVKLAEAVGIEHGLIFIRNY